MTQTVNIAIPSTSVVLSPLARFCRTVLHVAIAVGATIPTILALPQVAGSAVLVKDLGILGGYVLVVTAIINGLENTGVIPVLGAKPSAPVAVSISPRKVPEV